MKVNFDKKTETIELEAKRCFDEISNNCDEGKEITELFVDIDFAASVRSKLEELLKAANAEYDFLIVRRGTNPFTGKPESFTGETVGNQKRWKVKIY